MTEQATAEAPLTEAQKNYSSDRGRLRSRKAALLDLLRDRNWHPNYELARVGGLSFNSYLYQLRNAGWGIRSRLRTGGMWEQKLVGRTNVRRPRDELSGPHQRVGDEFELAILLFIDGGTRANEQGRKEGAIGVILQEPDCGQVLATDVDKVGPVGSPLEAEYHALIRGLKLAAKRQLPYVAVFSDSANLVNQITRGWSKNERATKL